MLKYYQNELNNINTMSKTNNIILISFIIILGLYIINFLLKKNNIETFTESNYYTVSIRSNNNNIGIATLSISYNDETLPISTIVFSNSILGKINDINRIRIQLPSDYYILAIYNSPAYDSYYFYCCPLSVSETSEIYETSVPNEINKLRGFIIYKNFLINYGSKMFDDSKQKLLNQSERPTIINTVANITYTLLNNNSSTLSGETEYILEGDKNVEYGYIRIKQNKTEIGEIISFKTGKYKLNSSPNRVRYTDDYNRLLNLVDSTGKNIANYIISSLDKPSKHDEITIRIPDYHVYAYYGTSKKICFKTSEISSYVHIYYKIDGEELTNIIISKRNYSMVYSNTAKITNIIGFNSSYDDNPDLSSDLKKNETVSNNIKII